MGHWTNDEIGAAVQNWFRVRVELSPLERLNEIQ